MKYRLKDRELQKKLDALTCKYKFTERLQVVCEKHLLGDLPYIIIRFGQPLSAGVSPFEFTTMKYEIEAYEEYNPKAWNKFPEVEPHEGVWMRCVMTDIHHTNRIVRVGAKFSSGAWRDHEGVAFEPRFRVDKFRPWDDDEIEAEQTAEDKKDMHLDAIAARAYLDEED